MKTNYPPVLSYDNGLWSLGLPHADGDDQSFVLYIHQDHSGEPPIFRVGRWDMGDCVECVTRKEYEERVAGIREHEGEAAAQYWHMNQTHVEIISDKHPVWKLQGRWLALMELELFTPSFSHTAEWPFMGSSEELKAGFDKIRQEDLSQAGEY
jgi:hypothetical protein